MNRQVSATEPRASAPPTTAPTIYWRVEGTLIRLSAMRLVAFLTWNAQGFTERWWRRWTTGFVALLLPLVYAAHRTFATRLLHTLLRGMSQDRLDLLGEEYFNYVLKPRLKSRQAQRLQEALASGARVVLVSHSLDHVVRPLANHLGVAWIIANRLEFRDGLATGRLLAPIVRPASIMSFRAVRRALGLEPGRIEPNSMTNLVAFADSEARLEEAICPARRRAPPLAHPIVLFEPHRRIERLSVREALRGKHILLVGATGFIGKVWLVQALMELPDIGKIFLLIRRQRSATALRRFEKSVEESPVFDPLHERHGPDLPKWLAERVEILEGDVTQPGLGLDAETQRRLARQLDLIINSSGLTDFNPDLRTALTVNVDGTVHLLDFLRRTDHAALLHLSTCYVIGERDGRVTEELTPNYTPRHLPDFDVERERQSLHELADAIEQRAESPELSEELKRLALEKTRNLSDAQLEVHLQKYRTRWSRAQMVEAGMRRAKELGWPNTYCFTKSLAESLIAWLAADLPVAIVRPSITETSTHQPFRGWNEGVNTSAPLSYLLGTFFRQLPSNERKCLDLIPVDLVSRGMMLVAAALVARRHERLYQLATSACNPCDMGRSIELTGLAHRKHYMAQQGLEHWLRARFDTIPVSKARYQRFSAPRQKAMLRALRRFSAPLPFVQSPLIRKERDLERLEKLIELYEPFILHNEHVFEALNVEILSAALPPEEQDAFGYDAHAIDWWEYWINIHVPALRKWTYPLIEGRPVETAAPRGTFHLPPPTDGAAAEKTA